MNKTNKVLLVVAGIAIIALCIVPMALGFYGSILNRTSSTQPTKQTGASTDQGEMAELTTQGSPPTPTKESLYLNPNYLKYPDTACFFHSGGLTCLDQDGWHVYDRDDFKHPLYLPYDIIQCADGQIFIKSVDLYKFDGQTLEKLSKISQEIDMLRNVKMIACGIDGDLWAAHSHGVSHYDGNTWMTFDAKQYLGSGEGVEFPDLVAIAPNGVVWVETGDSIASYDGSIWQVFEEGQGFDEDPNPRDMKIDQDGNIWAIKGYRALLKYDGHQWIVYESPDGMLRSIAIDQTGKIWLATDKGITSFDPVTSIWGIRFGLEALPEDYITDIQFDQQGRLWATSWYGIYVQDILTWTIFQMHTADLFDNEPNKVVVLGNGPPLPALIQKEPGSVSGKLTNPSVDTYSNIQVEVCLRGVIIVFYGATPCARQAFHALATVNPDGTFLVENIPQGNMN
jgi:hypothetical protein